MKISEIILEWFKKNKRVLPWRETKDPYPVWISEIILQQTRVNQGLEYYHAFMKRFPDVASLAAAREQDVIRIWQGLGYYSRARNLHAASKQVMEDFGGKLPGDYESLLSLKGIGPYTAAAIASISSNEAVPVVDGNVARVLSRLFAVEEPVNSTLGAKRLRELAFALLDLADPGEYNQAVMEFGALQCIPGKPDCLSCPLADYCEALKKKKVDRYPVKLKKVKMRVRFFTYFILRQEDYTYINKRSGNDIWKNLFEFPCSEHKGEILPESYATLVADLMRLKENAFRITGISGIIKHQLTHQRIFARFVHVRILEPSFEASSDYIRISFAELQDYPLPRLIERYLEALR